MIATIHLLLSVDPITGTTVVIQYLLNDDDVFTIRIQDICTSAQDTYIHTYMNESMNSRCFPGETDYCCTVFNR